MRHGVLPKLQPNATPAIARSLNSDFIVANPDLLGNLKALTEEKVCSGNYGIGLVYDLLVEKTNVDIANIMIIQYINGIRNVPFLREVCDASVIFHRMMNGLEDFNYFRDWLIHWRIVEYCDKVDQVVIGQLVRALPRNVRIFRATLVHSIHMQFCEQFIKIFERGNMSIVLFIYDFFKQNCGIDDAIPSPTDLGRIWAVPKDKRLAYLRTDLLHLNISNTLVYLEILEFYNYSAILPFAFPCVQLYIDLQPKYNFVTYEEHNGKLMRVFNREPELEYCLMQGPPTGRMGSRTLSSLVSACKITCVEITPKRMLKTTSISQQLTNINEDLYRDHRQFLSSTVMKKKRKKKVKPSARDKAVAKKIKKLEAKIRDMSNRKLARLEKFGMRGGVMSSIIPDKSSAKLEQFIDSITDIANKGVTHNISTSVLSTEFNDFVDKHKSDFPFYVLCLVLAFIISYDMSYYVKHGEFSKTLALLIGLLEIYVLISYKLDPCYEYFVKIGIAFNAIKIAISTYNKDSGSVVMMGPKPTFDFSIENPLIKTLCMAITGIMYIAVFAVKPKGDAISTILARLKNINVAAASFNHFSEYLGSICQYIVSVFTDPDEASFIIKVSPYPELEEFAEEHRDIVKAFQEGENYDFMNSVRVFKLDRALTQFIHTLPHSDEIKPYRDKALYIQRSIKSIADKFNANLYRAGRPKRVPVVVGLFGPTRSGKSTLVFITIIFMVFKSKFPTRVKRRMLRNMYSEIYCLFPDQDFWNGFNGQSFLVLDEFGCLKSDVTAPLREGVELLRVANIVDYKPDQAELHNKGRISADTIEAVIITSNRPFIQGDEFECPEALTNRIHCAWLPVPRADLCTDDSLLGLTTPELYSRRFDPIKRQKAIDEGKCGKYGIEIHDFFRWDPSPIDIKTPEKNLRVKKNAGKIVDPTAYDFWYYLKDVIAMQEKLSCESDHFITLFERIQADLAEEYGVIPESADIEVTPEDFSKTWENLFSKFKKFLWNDFDKDHECPPILQTGGLSEELLESRVTLADELKQARLTLNSNNSFNDEYFERIRAINPDDLMIYTLYDTMKWRDDKRFAERVDFLWKEHAQRLRDIIERFNVKEEWSMMIWFEIVKDKTLTHLIYLSDDALSREVWRMFKRVVFRFDKVPSIYNLVVECLTRNKHWITLGAGIATIAIVVPSVIEYFNTKLPADAEEVESNSYRTKTSVKARTRGIMQVNHPTIEQVQQHGGSSFKNVYDTIASVIDNNMYKISSVRRKEGKEISLYHGKVTFIRSHTAISLRHFFDLMTTYLEEGYEVIVKLSDMRTDVVRFMIPFESLILYNLGDMDIGIKPVFKEFMYDSTKKMSYHTITENFNTFVSDDFCGILFPSYVRPHSNISKKIWPADIEMDQYRHKAFTCSIRDQGPHHGQEKIGCMLISNCVPFTMSMMRYTEDPDCKMFKRSLAIFCDVPSQHADCGDLLYIYDSVNNNVYIAGLHCAGQGGLSVFIPITSMFMTPFLDYTESKPIDFGAVQMGGTEHISTLFPSHCIVVGKTKPIYTPTVSNIIPSPLAYHMPSVYKPNVSPAPLRPYNGIDPLHDARVRFGKPSLPFPKRVLDNGNRIAIRRYNERSMKSVEPRQVWSYKEAVAGRVGVFDGISRKTSDGARLLRKGVVKLKQEMWGREGDYTLDTPKALAFEKLVRSVIVKMENREYVPFLYIDFLKDELKSSRKTRMFCAGELIKLIISRMYCGSCNLWMQENRIANGWLVGLNVQSLEFTKLGLHLLKHPYMIPMDYKNYDGSLKAQVHSLYENTLNNYYAGFSTVQEDNVRVMLSLSSKHSLHVTFVPRSLLTEEMHHEIDELPLYEEYMNQDEVFEYSDIGIVYLVDNGNPSGDGNTTPINCDTNEKLMYGVVSELASIFLEYIDDDEILDNVDIVVYGDDIILSVSQKYSFITFSVIQEYLELYDVIVTPDDKNRVGEIPHASLWEITILKCHFVADNITPGYSIISRPALSSILEPIYWELKNRKFSDTKLIIQTALDKLSTYDFNTFMTIRDCILRACKLVYGWSPSRIDYFECRSAYHSIDTEY
jgi:hypothetical protein